MKIDQWAILCALLLITKPSIKSFYYLDTLTAIYSLPAVNNLCDLKDMQFITFVMMLRPHRHDPTYAYKDLPFPQVTFIYEDATRTVFAPSLSHNFLLCWKSHTVQLGARLLSHWP